MKNKMLPMQPNMRSVPYSLEPEFDKLGDLISAVPQSLLLSIQAAPKTLRLKEEIETEQYFSILLRKPDEGHLYDKQPHVAVNI